MFTHRGQGTREQRPAVKDQKMETNRQGTTGPWFSAPVRGIGAGSFARCATRSRHSVPSRASEIHRRRSATVLSRAAFELMGGAIEKAAPRTPPLSNFLFVQVAPRSPATANIALHSTSIRHGVLSRISLPYDCLFTTSRSIDPFPGAVIGRLIY